MESSRWYANSVCNKCYCKNRRKSSSFLDKEREYHREYRKTEKAKNYQREYQREYQKQYAKKQSVKLYRSSYKKTEEYKKRDRARRRKNYKSDPGKYKHQVALRSHRIRQATPPWVDKSQLLKIYKECPPGMEVDHIMPLKHELFCGLHVPWNLQYLTPFQNRSKKNRV